MLEKLEGGTEYKDIKKLIIVNILDYEMLGFEEYISETEIVLKEHRDYEMLKNMKWYFIELPKFRNFKVDMDDSHDLGYALHKEFWHKGIACEASKALINQLKKMVYHTLQQLMIKIIQEVEK